MTSVRWSLQGWASTQRSPHDDILMVGQLVVVVADGASQRRFAGRPNYLRLASDSKARTAWWIGVTKGFSGKTHIALLLSGTPHRTAPHRTALHCTAPLVLRLFPFSVVAQANNQGLQHHTFKARLIIPSASLTILKLTSNPADSLRRAAPSTQILFTRTIPSSHLARDGGDTATPTFGRYRTLEN